MELPHSEKDEAELLGACLKSKSIQKQVIREVDPDAFYIKENYYIYKAIRELNSIGKFADLHTVGDYIESKKYPVEYEVILAISYHGDYIDVNHYIGSILSLHSKRKIAAIAQDLQRDVFSDKTAIELHTEYVRKLAGTVDSNAGNFVPAKDIAETFQGKKSYMTVLDERIYNKKHGIQNFQGFHTGYPSLDGYIGGFGNGKSTIIGARSGTGKTTFIVNLMLLNQELYPDARIGFFSLEVSKEDIFDKMLATHMQISLRDLLDGNLSIDQRTKAADSYNFMKNSKMMFYDKTNLTISNALNVTRRAIMEYGLKMIFIDYMTILKPDRVTGNMYTDVDAVSKGIKEIAREFNIPTVTLAQLSRKSADRNDGTPQITDLRNSGSIEEDADNVIMIHRPPLINTMQSERSQLIVRKNRHLGDQGTIDLVYDRGRLYEAAPIDEEMQRLNEMDYEDED